MTDKEAPAVKDGSTEKKAPCQVTFFMDDQVQKGTSIHLSERGMLVNCPFPAPLNKKIKLVLLFPGFRNPVEIQGEVVWTNIHGSVDSHTPRGMGVKFLGVDRDLERMLGELSAQYDSLKSIYSCYYA